ncbi:MAG: hypothetical protein ACSHWS_00545 [Sulfitobacter sp.]
MRKQYFILLALSGILTALSLIPGMPMVITFLTLGIGLFVLIAAINLFVFLLCIFPLTIQRLPQSIAVVLSAVLLLIGFFGPGYMSARATEQIVAERLTNDFRSDHSFANTTEGGMEIIRPQTLNSASGQRILSNKVCDLLCQRALHGGQIDWVRVVAKDYDNTIKDIFTFARGDGTACTNELCFVYAENTDDPANMTFELEVGHGRPNARGRKPQGLADLGNIHTIKVFDGPKETGKEIWHQTELEISKFGMVSFFGVRINDDRGLAPPLMRVSSNRNAINLDKIADALNLKLAAPMLPKAALPQYKLRRQRLPAKPLVNGDTAKIASLLDQTGEISKQSEQEIGNWLGMALRADALSRKDVSLIMQVARDPRLEAPLHLGHLLRSRKEVQAVMLPWLFDAMEHDTGASIKTLRNLFQELSAPQISNAQLTPYAERYHALLRKGEDDWQVVQSIGRFGFDPAPLLWDVYKRTGASTNYLPHGEYAMRAVCASDAKWHERLVPIVRDIVEIQIQEDKRTRPSFETRKALTFLSRTGHRDEVITIIKASRWKSKSKLLRSNLTNEKPGFGQRKGVCG